MMTGWQSFFYWLAMVFAFGHVLAGHNEQAATWVAAIFVMQFVKEQKP